MMKGEATRVPSPLSTTGMTSGLRCAAATEGEKAPLSRWRDSSPTGGADFSLAAAQSPAGTTPIAFPLGNERQRLTERSGVKVPLSGGRGKRHAPYSAQRSFVTLLR